MAAILTFAEQREGKLRRPSLEAVSEVRRLAAALSASVEAVLIGAGVGALVGELAAYGAHKVHRIIIGSKVFELYRGQGIDSEKK